MSDVRVTVEDLESGETDIKTIPFGDYIIVTSNPCHVHGVQVYANGTHVVTIKDVIPGRQP
jgi:hypothetical protein